MEEVEKLTKILKNGAKANKISISLKGEKRKETKIYVQIFFLGVFNMQLKEKK